MSTPRQPGPLGRQRLRHVDRPSLGPPQFRLSTMMLLIAMLCGLFAISASIGPLGAFALGLFVLGVIAHVAGNAIGTRLREIGDIPQPPDVKGVPLRPKHLPPTEEEYAPTTRLSRRYALGWFLTTTIVIGAAVGAVGGGVALARAHGPQATIGHLAVGAAAFAIIGGFFGFLGGGFLHVTGSALREAIRERK